MPRARSDGQAGGVRFRWFESKNRRRLSHSLVCMGTSWQSKGLDRWRDSTHPQTMMLNNSRIRRNVSHRVPLPGASFPRESLCRQGVRELRGEPGPCGRALAARNDLACAVESKPGTTGGAIAFVAKDGIANVHRNDPCDVAKFSHRASDPGDSERVARCVGAHVRNLRRVDTESGRSIQRIGIRDGDRESKDRGAYCCDCELTHDCYQVPSETGSTPASLARTTREPRKEPEGPGRDGVRPVTRAHLCRPAGLDGPAEQLFSRLKALLSAKTFEALFAPRLDA